MEVIVLKQFAKDLKKLKSDKLNEEVLQLIEALESVETIREMSNVKKMKGFTNSYRFRIGDYRVGCFVENDKIELVRIAHRKEIYSIFP
jgi:mRNA interferase RelE/StbE